MEGIKYHQSDLIVRQQPAADNKPRKPGSPQLIIEYQSIKTMTRVDSILLSTNIYDSNLRHSYWRWNRVPANGFQGKSN